MRPTLSEKLNRAKIELNMSDIDHFRTKLIAAREALLGLADTRKASTATVVLDQSSVGRLSRMDALQQQAMALNSRQRAERELRRIEAALRRCDDGSYGYCISCDEPIDPRRLELDPAVPLLVHRMRGGTRFLALAAARSNSWRDAGGEARLQADSRPCYISQDMRIIDATSLRNRSTWPT